MPRPYIIYYYFIINIEIDYVMGCAKPPAGEIRVKTTRIAGGLT